MIDFFLTIIGNAVFAAVLAAWLFVLIYGGLYALSLSLFAAIAFALFMVLILVFGFRGMKKLGDRHQTASKSQDDS